MENTSKVIVSGTTDFVNVARIYRSAFAGAPWYEVSRCSESCDKKAFADSNFGPCAVGEVCDRGITPADEAYPIDDLINSFESIDPQKAAWCQEYIDGKLAVVSLMQTMTAREIAIEKYQDDSAMREWLQQRLGEFTLVGWLDELFADFQIRPSGNMKNFKNIVNLSAKKLGVSAVAARTINPKVIHAFRNNFPDESTLFTPEIDVPDSRSFISIWLSNEGTK